MGDELHSEFPATTFPGNWRRVPFPEVVFFQEGPGIRNWQYRDSGIPFLNIRCLVNGRLDRASMNCLDPAEVDTKYRHFLLDAGDYVVSSSGTIGRIAEVKSEDLPCMLNTSVIRMRPKVPRDLDRRFLRCFLSSSHFQTQINAFASGSVQVNYGPTHLKKMWVILPPLSEQRAIAHILCTLDDKIEVNRRMNETLEGMARAVFKSWFVDFDPVRAKMEGRDTGFPKDIADLFPDRLEPSEIGEIPEGWEVSNLGDVAALRRRGVDPASVASDTPYIGLADMPRGSIALTDWGGAGRVLSRKSAFEAGDILFGKLRPYFHKVGIAPVAGLCSTDIVVLGARKPKWSAFVLAFVSSSAFVAHTSQTATGTKMPRTSWKAMNSYELCRPTDDVAAEFQRLVTPILRRIVGNIHESRTLAAVRDALLPKLMSGELRLAKPAQSMEA